MAGDLSPHPLRCLSRQAEAAPASTTRIDEQSLIWPPFYWIRFPLAHRLPHGCPGRLDTRARGRRSMCADSPVSADSPVLFPRTRGALVTPTKPWKSDSAVTRDATRNDILMHSHLVSYPLFSLTFITIPHGLRYRAFARGRGPLPTVLTHDWPFPIFPDSPSPFTNGPNVGHVTLGQDATYLLPILISISRHASHVYLSLIMLLTLSSARLSSFAFHIMISFSRIRPSPVDFGPHVGACGFIVHFSSSSSPSSSRSHHTHCIVFVSHRFLCSLTHGWSTSRTGRLYLGSSTSVTNQVVLTNETELTTL